MKSSVPGAQCSESGRSSGLGVDVPMNETTKSKLPFAKVTEWFSPMPEYPFRTELHRELE